jgi:hypothetical protein
MTDAIGLVVATAVAGVSGYAAGIVTFRTRLALADQAAAAQHTTDQERFQRIENRLKTILMMTADIARTTGADKRFSDLVLRMLSEEEG